MRNPLIKLLAAAAVIGLGYVGIRTALDLRDFKKLVEVLEPFEVDPNAPPETAVTDVELPVRNDPTPRFFDAPEQVLDIALQIASGGIPAPDLLAELTPEQMNASYSRPFPEKQPTYGHTLLREAVIQINPDAARALVAAGARTDYNTHEMPYQAVLLETSRERVWYPDYEKGNALLQLWLEQDGDPNQFNTFYGTLGPLLNNVPAFNLEGMMILLKAGADPWLTLVTNVSESGWESESRPFMTTNANASIVSSETMFRLGREGLLKPGPTEHMTKLDQMYQRTATQYLGSTGPQNLGTIWAMQMAVKEVYQALDLPVTGDLAELMAIQVPSGIGGFFLASGEIRSPDDPDQIVNNNNQMGTERWDG